MDKLLRAEIIGEVTRAMREVIESMEERWVSEKELSSYFSFFSRGWLRYHGHLLPREKVKLRDSDGTLHVNGWGYPLHRIERMVLEGKFRDIEYSQEQAQAI